MKEITEAQLAKLPAWARTKINALEVRIEELQEQIDMMRGKNQGTGLISYKGMSVRQEDQVFLPDRSIIQFGTGWSAIDVSMHHSKRGSEVYVNGRSSVKIMPQAANAFYVQVQDR